MIRVDAKAYRERQEGQQPQTPVEKPVVGKDLILTSYAKVRWC